jgi:hypothetical protein
MANGYAITPRTGTQSTASYDSNNDTQNDLNIALYADEDEKSYIATLDTMLKQLLPTDLDIGQALSAKPYHITFGQLGTVNNGANINGQAGVGGNDIILDIDLLANANTEQGMARLKDVFLHELTHTVGYSHANSRENFDKGLSIFTDGNTSNTTKPDECCGTTDTSTDGNSENSENGGYEWQDESTNAGFINNTFGPIKQIDDALPGFDLLDKIDALYENGKPSHQDVQALMTEFFEHIDSLPDEQKNNPALLDGLAMWIKAGFHGGEDNDNASHTHGGGAKGQEAETGRGKLGAAFVLRHFMQASRETRMHELFREGDRKTDMGALEDLDGASLGKLMEDEGGLMGLFGNDGKADVFYGASAKGVQNSAAARAYFNDSKGSDETYSGDVEDGNFLVEKGFVGQQKGEDMD